MKLVPGSGGVDGSEPEAATRRSPSTCTDAFKDEQNVVFARRQVVGDPANDLRTIFGGGHRTTRCTTSTGKFGPPPNESPGA
jgi:hypothetical protein